MNTISGKKTFPSVLVVGMHFRGEEAKAAVGNFMPPLTLRLEREPLNPYDSFAIKAFYGDLHIGYVERKQAMFISPWMDQGWAATCTVEELQSIKNNLHPVCTIELSA
jgi:hypothetical protein